MPSFPCFFEKGKLLRHSVEHRTMNMTREDSSIRPNQNALRLSSNVRNLLASNGSRLQQALEAKVTTSTFSAQAPLSQQNRSRRPAPLDLSILNDAVDDTYINAWVSHQSRFRTRVSTHARMFNPFAALSPESPVCISEPFWIE